MAKHLEKFSYDNYDEDDESGLGQESEILIPYQKKENREKDLLYHQPQSKQDTNKKNQFSWMISVMFTSLISLMGTVFIINNDGIAEGIKIVVYIFAGAISGLAANLSSKERN